MIDDHERKKDVKQPVPAYMKFARWLIPIAVLGGAIAFKAVSSGTTKAAVELPPIPVRTAVPLRGDITRSLKLNAHIESENMITVLPLVSGILQDLFVDAGQAVKKGDIIARVDAARYELQLKQAEAAYLSAKSSFERVTQLFRAGATTQQNYDQTKAQYDAYASQYELARLQLGYANVTSPVDGVVLIKHLSVGSIASPERPLFTIGDLDDLVVRARIPERYYRLFTDAQAFMPILIAGPDGSVNAGRLKSVSPFVSSETKNFETTVAIEGNLRALRPGMFVTVTFELDRWTSVLSLPFAALAGGTTLWYVQDNVARSLSFIPEKASDQAFVVPEEWAGRQFIVEGYYFARDGSAVSVIGGGTP